MRKEIFILLLLSVQMICCQNKTIKPTPKEYISNVKAPKDLYLKDSIRLVKSIKKEIKEHKGGYHSKAYDSFTKIIIDTIMYSPDYDKLIFFVIDKKENKKIYPDNFTEKQVNDLINNGHTKIPYNGYHFTGKAYIGLRNNDVLIVKHFGITTAHYNNIFDVKKRQKNVYFKEYSAVKHKGYEYNLDDKRFWNKDIWNFDK